MNHILSLYYLIIGSISLNLGFFESPNNSNMMLSVVVMKAPDYCIRFKAYFLSYWFWLEIPSATKWT